MDKLLYKDWQKVVANDIMAELQGKPTVISITGTSGTAKTEIANILHDLLWKNKKYYKIIHTDNFYDTRPNKRRATRKRTGKIGYCEIDLSSFASAMAAYLMCGMWDGIIVEGIYASDYYLLFDNVFNILLEATERETKKFRVDRGKEKQDPFRKKVLAIERKDIKNSITHFDMILNLKDYI